jgi:hypothetical protein
LGEIHRLILAHGREKAREMVPVRQRRLIDVAAEVMAEDAQSLGACCSITGRNKYIQYMVPISGQRVLHVVKVHCGP